MSKLSSEKIAREWKFMPEKEGLQHLLSQVAEITVSNQLDEVEQIDIDLQTNLLKIVQGRVDQVSLVGQGLVVQDNIRVQEIALQTDDVNINPLSAILGAIKLNSPVNAIARVVLKSADINRALTSDFIRRQVKKIELEVAGETVSFDLQDIKIFLLSDDKIGCKIKVLLAEMGNTRTLDFTIIIHPRIQAQTFLIESINFQQGEGVAIELILVLLQTVKRFLQIPYFHWNDTTLQIKNIKTENDNLILMVEAHVKQIPT
jgi:hypothetical protein